MLYDKHEDVYVFPVAEMRKWALKDHQNPHMARLCSLLAGVVPPPMQAFFSMIGHPPPRLFLPFSNYPALLPPSPETPGRKDGLQANGKFRIIRRAGDHFYR